MVFSIPVISRALAAWTTGSFASLFAFARRFDFRRTSTRIYVAAIPLMTLALLVSYFLQERAAAP